MGHIDFNPPTPCGVGLGGRNFAKPNIVYFNPPTPCGVGRYDRFLVCNATKISIHPPRAGWDTDVSRASSRPTDFNPPTPCGVGLASGIYITDPGQFQSTHPVRGGTYFART